LRALLVAAVLGVGTPLEPPDGGLSPASPLVPGFVAEWARTHAKLFDAERRSDLRGPSMWKEHPPGQFLPPGFVSPSSLAPLIHAVGAGVVNISAYASEVSAPEGKPATPETGAQSLGSGFILGEDGYIVTNQHVVENAQQIRVRLADGREFLASVVGMDAFTDLALLKLTGDQVRNLPFVYLGDSDKLSAGDWVVAIGNPLGFDHSVSHGIVSAKERVLGRSIFDDFIQTDALINPGNSGGPLFNMRGEVVGVNAAIVSHAQGIGFAVPINMVKDLLPNLRVNGHLARGWIGLTVAEQEAAPGRKVAVVQDVFGGGPAMKAGLHEGDELLAVGGKPVEGYQQLLRRVSLLAPGSLMRFTVARGSATREVAVEVAERPAQEAVSSLGGYGNFERFGLIVQDVDRRVAQSLHVEPYRGVLVTGVVPDGTAAHAGLREGDIITRFEHEPVEDIHGLRLFMDRETGHRQMLLGVERGRERRTVALSP
jgi:serine protease Do